MPTLLILFGKCGVSQVFKWQFSCCCEKKDLLHDGTFIFQFLFSYNVNFLSNLRDTKMHCHSHNPKNGPTLPSGGFDQKASFTSDRTSLYMSLRWFAQACIPQYCRTEKYAPMNPS